MRVASMFATLWSGFGISVGPLDKVRVVPHTTLQPNYCLDVFVDANRDVGLNCGGPLGGMRGPLGVIMAGYCIQV